MQESNKFINLAKEKIHKLAKECTVKDNVCYLVRIDEEHKGEEFETELELGDFCSDCIQKVLDNFSEMFPNYERIKDKISYRSISACLIEEDGFETCELCGELFDYIWLTNDDDLSHYSDPETKLNLSNQQTCWELYQILDTYELAGDNEAKIFISIAHRILGFESLDQMGLFE